MCLYTKTKNALIAENDIKVYKIVYKCNGKYYSPYIEKVLTERASNVSTIAYESYNGPYKSEYYITDQGVHAFTSLKRANYLCSMDCGYVIITGIIPKGTRYWKGNDKDIAAKRIKFDLSKEVQYVSWLDKIKNILCFQK